MAKSETTNLGQRITSWRERSGLTRAQLAGKVGCSGAYVGRIESGKQEPTLAVLRQIAAALQVSLSSLLD